MSSQKFAWGSAVLFSEAVRSSDSWIESNSDTNQLILQPHESKQSRLPNGFPTSAPRPRRRVAGTAASVRTGSRSTPDQAFLGALLFLLLPLLEAHWGGFPPASFKQIPKEGGPVAGTSVEGKWRRGEFVFWMMP